jgi:hypothetical protein
MYTHQKEAVESSYIGTEKAEDVQFPKGYSRLRDFCNPDFVKQVKKQVAQNGFEPAPITVKAFGEKSR